MEKKDLYFFSGLFTLLIFVVFTLVVNLGYLAHIDYATTVAFQKLIPDFLITPFSLFSILGTTEVIGLFFIFFLLLATGFKKIYVLLLFILVIAIEVAGKAMIVHKPPQLYFLKTDISLGLPSSSVAHELFSYPSGHAARTAFISGFIILLVLISTRLSKFQKKILIISVLTFDFIMFVSRVYLGEHWISDVVGGALLGFSLALLCSYFLDIKTAKK